VGTVVANMTSIILHRWQPKKKRNRIQSFVVSGEPDAMCNHWWGLDVVGDTASDSGHIKCRTQHVDRIEFDAKTDTLHVWMSPLVERPYVEQSSKHLTEDKKQAIDTLYSPMTTTTTKRMPWDDEEDQ
jgi:hypothetical protein